MDESKRKLLIQFLDQLNYLQHIDINVGEQIIKCEKELEK